MNDRALRSATHRLRYRSRSAAVSVALACASIVALWIAVETVFSALGENALLVPPHDLVALAGQGNPWVIGSAAVFAAGGLLCILLGLLPGHLTRRQLRSDRAVYLVDDAVIAAGLSRAAASAAGVSATHVRTTVSRRRAVSAVQPATGYPPDRDATDAAVTRVLDAIGPQPALRPYIRIERSGALQ